MIKTKEGANAYEHSLDHCVEFFSKGGSMFVKKESFYEGEESALSLFQKAWIVDPKTSFKLALWCRDCRGGAGNRSASREIFKWIAENDPEWIVSNIGWIPLVGRWDDLRSLYETSIEDIAAKLWGYAIIEKNVLAAKWADRTDKPLQKYFLKNEAGLRKTLANIRKAHIVEYQMCTKQWNQINYEHVPSVAMARYTKAFGRNDAERFNAYKEALKKGEKKVHSDVLFPHDCVRTARRGDGIIANAQFHALPNYMPEDRRIMVLCDTSGSMSARIAGEIQAVDISQGLALYCSAKLPKDNPFYKKFMAFESEGSFKDWNKLSFSEAVNDGSIFDGACGSTMVGLALQTILKQAMYWKLTKEQMPNVLLIVSDMQFHEAGRNDDDFSSWIGRRAGRPKRVKAEVEKVLDDWEANGYDIPTVIYWNLAGYAGQPTTSRHNNVALVSGFSPAILRSIFDGDDLTPRGVMLRTLKKYDVVVP